MYHNHYRITTNTTSHHLQAPHKSIVQESGISGAPDPTIKKRHTIRHQMTNILLTPTRKRLTYCKRWWRMNMRTGGRRCIVWRRRWMRQGRSQPRQWQRRGVMTADKYLKCKRRCMQILISQKRRGILAANRQQIQFPRRKRRWQRCGDSTFVIWPRRWKRWK